VILDWRNFVLRSDIKNLPLEEQRRKFLKEQLDHDNLLSEQKQRQYEFYMSQMQSKGGAAGGGGFTGNASDGPIAGATVTSNIGTTTTDTLGNFTFPTTPTSEITVTGGTDSITGVAFTGELKGFPQFKTVSPLTTLAFHLKEEDASLTADSAVDLLFASSSTLFGIELEVADKDIMLNKDYVAESILEDNQKAIAAQSIATYLESVTEMVGSAVKSADESAKGSNFTVNSAKVQGYKSIARQIQQTRGAKTEIDPEGLFDLVQRPDGQSFTRGNTGSLDITARRTVKTSINNVRTQLAELSRSELYNANYLTTQIQAVNRGVKEDYKVQAERLARGDSSNFKSINQIVTESTGSLAQIEKDKPNETDANTSKKPSREFFQLGGMTYTMQEKGQDAVTLSFKSDPGQMFVVGTEIRKGQFLNNDSGPFRPNEAGNFVKAAPTIIATQVTASSGKVYEITLANPGFQVLSSQLKDAIKYLPVATGGYTMQTENKIGWSNAATQPFTASIAANQTKSSATISDKIGSTLYEIEYNSGTSRYEFSTTPQKGTKTLHAHIADFTNEAQWTSIGNPTPPGIRFQINNFDTHHISDNGRYSISAGGTAEVMSNKTFKLGGRILEATLTVGKSKVNIALVPTDGTNAPNGPFTFRVGLGNVTTTAQFTNNVLTVVDEDTTYTITYTPK
tara:strand:+ start:3186 stop:5228 length:2043 start_codon:yes stop_codon:yes gene_type:complete